MEKIAYIHGYGGSSNGESFKTLQKYLGDKFEIVGIDYNETEPNIQEIKNDLDNRGIKFVIGSSIGGFLTLNLGSEYKKLVFNPCMKPSIELPKINVPEDLVAKYVIMEKEYFANLEGNDLDKASTFGFFGSKDELFGPFGYKKLFKCYYKNAANMTCGHHITDAIIKQIAYRIVKFFNS